jgi:predicted metal-dependent hydrolase
MSTENTNKIKYGNRIITYTLIHRSRKTLGITVTPEKQVIVRCPYNASLDKINKVIHKRLKWISNKLSYFESLPALIPERKYISGETHYYLGKQYRLKIIKSPWEMVKLKGAYIFVFTQKGDNKRIVELLLDSWYRDKAEKRFNIILNNWIPKFNKYNVSKPRIVIKKMNKRWGSCNTKNKITLNQELIKTPIQCINYVIVHELCHMKYRNHDKEYYKLLSLVFPEWNKKKIYLDNFHRIIQ